MASTIGQGTWAMGGWMWGGTDEAQSVKAIRAAIDEGVTLIDTAPAYGLGKAEEIVGEAIAGRRDDVVVATKCGLVWHTDKGTHFFDEHGKKVYRYLGRDSIFFEVEQSLRRLRTDHIDLYITHWQDATTPVAETMGALLDLKRQRQDPGDRRQQRGARNVEGIHGDRPGRRDPGAFQHDRPGRSRADLLPLCRENNVSVLSYSSLALGPAVGQDRSRPDVRGDDLRKDDPRFSPASLERRRGLHEGDRAGGGGQAGDAGAGGHRLDGGAAGHHLRALRCARMPEQAAENAAAGRLSLSEGEIALIDAAIAKHLAGIDG